MENENSAETPDAGRNTAIAFSKRKTKTTVSTREWASRDRSGSRQVRVDNGGYGHVPTSTSEEEEEEEDEYSDPDGMGESNLRLLLCAPINTVATVLGVDPLGTRTRALHKQGGLSDPLVAATVIMCFFSISTIVFVSTSTLSTDFLRFGPSSGTYFFELEMDTWGNWALVAVFAVLDQIMKTYSDNIIAPWIGNDVQDHKQHTLKYSRSNVYSIRALYVVYTTGSWFYRIQLANTNLDIFLLMIVARMGVTIVITKLHVRGKRFGVPNTDTDNRTRAQVLEEYTRKSREGTLRRRRY